MYLWQKYALSKCFALCTCLKLKISNLENIQCGVKLRHVSSKNSNQCVIFSELQHSDPLEEVNTIGLGGT